MKFKDAIRHSVDKFTSSSFITKIKDEDATMVDHLEILQKINGLGYITNESQAGHKRRGDGYQTNERAYITGFMLETNATGFIKKIAIATDKIAMFLPKCGEDVYVPGNLDIPVTITSRSTEKEPITITNTHISNALPTSVWNQFRQELHIDAREKIVFIVCWDPKWNRNASGRQGLFTDVHRVLASI
jgi:hypothetical protein